MALSTQVRASTSSPFPWKYDVFLSFRGEDTRKGFTDYLYDRLQWQGIKTFRDDPGLERGTSISAELISAIKQSRFAIVVLSPDYASSKWCLLELCKILDCMEERGTILPVFYEVEPSDVRHQRGSFAEAFDEHEEKFGDKEVEAWRVALTKVAGLVGWTSKNYSYETELVKEIVQAMWSKVHSSPTVSGSLEMLVGMDAKLEEIDVLLDKEANDVRFIGIWGMGGVGKTTLARRVYENISDQFEVSIFLSNVREVSATHGLVHLQKQILSQIMKEENVQVQDVYSGIMMTKRCFCDKAMLLVLDDVDQVEQLETLVGEKDWFDVRSRIIITTRNRHVLVTHGIEKPHEVKMLNGDDALKLFCWKAFKKYEPEDDYTEQSNSFVYYAGGLPLALKTLGSFLYKRSPDAWSSTLKKLKETPNRTVFDILKISYEGLDKIEKKFFLDIACFWEWYQNEYALELLYSSYVCSRIAIDVLVERSLITISSKNQVCIHDLIKVMGCDIVCQESYEEPGRRSRLWLPNDISHVFTENTGTEAVEGILFDLPKLEEADWNLEAFSKMCKLQLLYIHNLRLSVGPKCLPNALRFLKWSWYPSKSLPPSFQPDELTELSLTHSNIRQLWNGMKYLDKLKSVDLSYSINLTKTPDFTGIQNLERLVFEGCTNLVKVHPSIALLKRLRVWNFRGCRSITSLPSDVKMEFLEIFDVSGCSKLKMIPEFMGQMKRLSRLCLGGTAVKNLPSSIERFSESLVALDLSGIVGIVAKERPYSHFLKWNVRDSSFGLNPRESPHPLRPLLASLRHLSSLTSLKLNDCNLREGEIPNDIGSLSTLRFLELGGNNFVTLPASIQLLSNLALIDVENCKRLEQLPELPLNPELWLNAINCPSLQVFPDPSDLCRFSTIDDPDSSYFLYSMLKRLLEEIPRSFERLCFLLPGSEIFEWFSNQSLGGTITEKVPSYSCNSSKWIGFAVCALLTAHDNPSAVPESNNLGPDESSIFCSFNSFGFWWEQVKHNDSGLLYFCFFRARHWKPENCPDDNLVEFKFKTERAVGSNRCLKVEKCGARALYEHDVEYLIPKMNQSKKLTSP